jgi:uncharacterized membrane protein HdeD (DUF308 family)
MYSFLITKYIKKQMKNDVYKPFFHFYVYNAVLAMVFGVILLIIPWISLPLFLFILAGFFIADGILHVINIIRFSRALPKKWSRILRSAAGIITGIIILIIPDISAVVLLYILAGWYIYVGIVEIIISSHYKEILTKRRYIVIFSIFSIIFGLFLVSWLYLYPDTAVVALAWFLGLSAILWGLGYLIYPLRFSRLFSGDEL